MYILTPVNLFFGDGPGSLSNWRAMNEFVKDPEFISGAQWQTQRLGARCAVKHARRAPCDGSKCDNWLHMTPYPISYRDAVVHDKLLMMSSLADDVIITGL